MGAESTFHKSWLTEVISNPHAFCKICKKEMTAIVTALQKHQSTTYYQERAKILQIPSSHRINSMFRGEQQGNDAVKETEQNHLHKLVLLILKFIII